MHFDAHYSSRNVLQQAWVAIIELGMATLKAINSLRFICEPSFQDSIDQAFKAKCCHLNILGKSALPLCDCRNFNLGFVTKARACEGADQE